MDKALPNALVGILKVVFAHHRYLYNLLCVIHILHKSAPLLHIGSTLTRELQLAQDCLVQPLLEHIKRHLVDAWKVLALHNAISLYIAEGGNLLQHCLIQVSLCAQNQNLRLYSHSLHLLYRVLCRLGLKLSCSLKIWYIGEVDIYAVFAKLPFELPYCLHKGGALYVANCSSYLCDYKVILPWVLFAQNPSLNLVCNVWHNLNCFAKVVAPSLVLYYGVVYTACCNRVVAGGLYSCKALIMTKVQVCLHTISGNIALSVLVWVKGARVYIYVWVKFLNCYAVAPGLQQFAYRCGDYPLSKR